MKITLLAIALCLSMPFYAQEQVKEISVLTIGNSFAQSVFLYLPKIVEATPGCKMVLTSANHGGCSLERHWSYVEKEEAEPDFRKYAGGTKKLRELLQSRKWDYVTLQQVSTFSWKPESYEPFATKLVEYVRKHSPTAEILIQQTWAYRVDSPNFLPKGTWGISQQEMHEKLSAAYQECAGRHKLRIIPTGLAVQLARERQERKFQAPDPVLLKRLERPQLPDQAASLCVGYVWGKDKKTGAPALRSDPNHLNKRGQFLQACVWFAFLFEKKASDIAFIPPEIDADDAAFLRKCAFDAVAMRVPGKHLAE